MINHNLNIDVTTYLKLFNHVNLLQLKYSKLLPVRMDFSFNKGSSLGQQRNSDFIFREMYALMQYLLEDEVIVAYQWVPEYAIDTGLHYHSVMYINAHRFVSAHIACTRAIEIWHYITGGEGRHFDCDLERYRYKRPLTMLHYSKASEYQTLLYAISYLAKKDQKFLNLNHEPFVVLSDVPEPSLRGRPRANRNANLHSYLPVSISQHLAHSKSF
ncbi:hypothetical protein [Thorsellia anophelis]|uniref:Inovirus Gp2 family protein n=1 Tax=Thorsellia anophelis DSM 18579 TaxID=1123402 RepID=A0A1I0CWE2_9GAMM|nr:hypothetical protein [Thorsellia anophelis]SET23895.1 Protein of unknown function [Thorsellia anophelis DSM 18579]